jgi:YbbR domain-containing protein
VQTQPIDVAGISSTTVRQVGLVPPNGSLLLQPAQMITATVHVIPMQLTESVQVLPSVTHTGADVVVADNPPPVTLTITGSAPNLAALGGGQLQVSLDAGGNGPGHYMLTPEVQNLPAGAVLDSVNPQQISVDLVSTDGDG